MDMRALVKDLEARREEELIRAESATCDASRAAHEGLAALYSAVIEGTMVLPRGENEPFLN